MSRCFIHPEYGLDIGNVIGGERLCGLETIAIPGRVVDLVALAVEAGPYQPDLARFIDAHRRRGIGGEAGIVFLFLCPYPVLALAVAQLGLLSAEGGPDDKQILGRGFGHRRHDIDTFVVGNLYRLLPLCSCLAADKDCMLASGIVGPGPDTVFLGRARLVLRRCQPRRSQWREQQENGEK
ncbi:MAG: hypothetical protein ACD_75C01491G0001 [uncultured bacterium]|nr:MAG: hypothetical protein ACD_75C01491G0001 [uncultured bacterium]